MSEAEEAAKHQISLSQAMLENLQRYVGTPNQGEACSIYRVLRSIQEGDPRAYKPQIVSIGPYHRDNPNLLAMEEHKWRYLHDLLVRKHRSDLTKGLDECIEKVRRSEPDARKYYSEPIVLNTDDFVKVMVLDGCFILQLFLNCSKDEWKTGDPIVAVLWMFSVIRRDLLKLENQIPLFILEDLLDLTVESRSPNFLRELTFHFFFSESEKERLRDKMQDLDNGEKVYHLLHLYGLIQLPTTLTEVDKSKERPTDTSTPSSCSCLQSILVRMRNPFVCSCCTQPPQTRDGLITIPCAVELGEAGLQIKKDDNAKTFLDVTFTDGVLHVPPLVIDDSTNSILRNLVAFEQCYPKTEHQYFTTYIMFLDCLVNTSRDVGILEQRGIIVNFLGNQEEVAVLVNSLGKDIVVGLRGYLAQVFQDVNNYCKSDYHRYRAMLTRDYFSNPWAIISVVAATVLLLMTLIQLIYAALSYHYPQNP